MEKYSKSDSAFPVSDSSVWLHDQPKCSPWVAGLMCHLELLTIFLPLLVGVLLACRPQLAQWPVILCPFPPAVGLTWRAPVSLMESNLNSLHCHKSDVWDKKNDFRDDSQRVQSVPHTSNHLDCFSWLRVERQRKAHSRNGRIRT